MNPFRAVINVDLGIEPLQSHRWPDRATRTRGKKEPEPKHAVTNNHRVSHGRARRRSSGMLPIGNTKRAWASFFGMSPIGAVCRMVPIGTTLLVIRWGPWVPFRKCPQLETFRKLRLANKYRRNVSLCRESWSELAVRARSGPGLRFLEWRQLAPFAECLPWETNY
jgi:hypothetical protein